VSSSGSFSTSLTARPVLKVCQVRLENPDQDLPLRLIIRVFSTPVAPGGPLVGYLVLDPLHERLVRILVQLPDFLVGKDEPVILGTGKGS